ncbi:hypothetical protein WMY93_000416 [Mugilogobius chulae]|uniref:Fibronectin type-III domain-containing protein n=1 Tax=Mugilogobius chulae TaxID=88201 RepID=A0AAW0Q7H2_9GOBI
MTLGELLLLLLMGVCDGVCALSAPSGLSMKSVNMRHTLSWLPLQDGCDTTVLYSVQYQGDFERLKNMTWLNSSLCQLTSLCHCDLSSDLGSDTDYILRVRAHCGRVLSPWKQLLPPFNRSQSVLLAPRLKLDELGTSDSVEARAAGAGAGESGALKAGPVRQRRSAGGTGVLRPGPESAALRPDEQRHSAPLCPHARSYRMVLEEHYHCGVAVLFSVGFLSTVLWFTLHGPPQICHKVALPESLKKWVSVPGPLQIQEEGKSSWRQWSQGLLPLLLCLYCESRLLPRLLWLLPLSNDSTPRQKRTVGLSVNEMEPAAVTLDKRLNHR